MRTRFCIFDILICNSPPIVPFLTFTRSGSHIIIIQISLAPSHTVSLVPFPLTLSCLSHSPSVPFTKRHRSKTCYLVDNRFPCTDLPIDSTYSSSLFLTLIVPNTSTHQHLLSSYYNATRFSKILYILFPCVFFMFLYKKVPFLYPDRFVVNAGRTILL